MPSPTQISVSQLQRLIGTADCPILIDVCIDEDFAADPRLIPAAKRVGFHRIEELAPDLIAKRVVVICQKGLKLSQGAAALLRANEVVAESLEGGNFAWRDNGGSLVPAEKIPGRKEFGGTLWVTRHRPKIDRIACPWLIRRFIDRDAKFLFVAPGEVLTVAEKFGATPFDVEGAYWSHRGAFCTFDMMIDEFGLHHSGLERLARVVRGADTDRHDLMPECAGFSAIMMGLSRMYRDDLEQLDVGMGILDAYYRWARDAFDETQRSGVQETTGQGK